VIFVSRYLVEEFRSVLDSFDIVLPAATKSLLIASRYAPWIAGAILFGLCLLIALRWNARSHLSSTILTALPLVGSLWRDRGIVEFADLLGLLLEQSVPLPKALELTATGLSNGSLAAACGESAQLAGTGMPLSVCVSRLSAFPPTLKPILIWGERQSATVEALASASDWFKDRCNVRTDFLTAVIPPIAFLVVIVTLMFVIGALLQPLIILIESLT
jgi:type II secretory pathway component PulF